MSAARAMTRCGRCGGSYTEEAWAKLDAIQTLGAAEVSVHVVAWPEERAVEVRACGKCGHDLARLTLVKG